MQNVNNLLTTQLDQLHFTWRGGLMSGNIRLGFFLGLLGVIYYLFCRIDFWWVAKLLWAYCLAWAIFIIEFPTWHYGIHTTFFRAAAGENAIEVALLPAFVLFLKDEHRRWLWRALAWVMVYELACVWFRWRGLLIAPSFNMAFVALYLPFGPLWLWFLAVPTILTHHAGTAQGMLAVYVLIYAWKKLPRVYFPLALLLGLGGAATAIIKNRHNDQFDMGGRLDRWSWTGRFMKSWLYADHTGATHYLNLKNILLGVGPNTFAGVSLLIDNFKLPSAIFLHNEFQQIPWELGLVGLGLALAVYARAVWLAWDDTHILMALGALVPFCLAWHPFRMFPSALLVLMIIYEAYMWIDFDTVRAKIRADLIKNGISKRLTLAMFPDK